LLFCYVKIRKAILLCGLLRGKNRLIGAEGGIRTRVGLLPNWFRVIHAKQKLAEF